MTDVQLSCSESNLVNRLTSAALVSKISLQFFCF